MCPMTLPLKLSLGGLLWARKMWTIMGWHPWIEWLLVGLNLQGMVPKELPAEPSDELDRLFANPSNKGGKEDMLPESLSTEPSDESERWAGPSHCWRRGGNRLPRTVRLHLDCLLHPVNSQEGVGRIPMGHEELSDMQEAVHHHWRAMQRMQKEAQNDGCLLPLLSVCWCKRWQPGE